MWPFKKSTNNSNVDIEVEKVMNFLNHIYTECEKISQTLVTLKERANAADEMQKSLMKSVGIITQSQEFIDVVKKAKDSFDASDFAMLNGKLDILNRLLKK